MTEKDNITEETLVQWLAQDHDISTRTMAEASYWAHQYKLAVEWAQKIEGRVKNITTVDGIESHPIAKNPRFHVMICPNGWEVLFEINGQDRRMAHCYRKSDAEAICEALTQSKDIL